MISRGDGWRLPGVKTWISNAPDAEHYMELGAAPLAAAAELLARRGRLPLHAAQGEPVAPGAAPPPLGLTPARELELLRLVGQGCTNVQIAERLLICRKTAPAHVSNILAKLGADRRAEATAIAAQLDLLDAPPAPVRH